MSATELLSQVKAWAAEGAIKAGEYSVTIASARQYVLDNYGQTGLIAVYITLGALALFVVSRLVMMAFSALKWLVVPSIVLAFAASLLLPVSFATALPVTITLCSLVLLFKG